MKEYRRGINTETDPEKMRLIFSGDRRSKTISIGRKLRRIFGKKLIGIVPWDGYKSRIYLERGGKER